MEPKAFSNIAGISTNGCNDLGEQMTKAGIGAPTLGPVHQNVH